MKIVSAHPWHLVAGLVIWAVLFVVLYGGVGVACKISPPTPDEGVFNWINITFLVFTLAAAGYLGTCAVLSWRMARKAEKHQPRFALKGAAALYLFATIAALAIGAPLVGLAPCI